MLALSKFEYAIWNLFTSFELTTVLIFFFPSVALRRHLLSAGSKVSTWPLRGTGFVRPSYFFSVMKTLPEVLHFWKSLVSSVRNCKRKRRARGWSHHTSSLRALLPRSAGLTGLSHPREAAPRKGERSASSMLKPHDTKSQPGAALPCPRF